MNGHTKHAWPHEIHDDCAPAWFDVPDQPCRSVNAETCCYCGRALKREESVSAEGDHL